MAVVKRKREKRGKRGEKHVWIAFVDPCCGGCTAVLCTLASFSLLHFNLSLFCFVALCNATHCHTLCYCEHLRFLSRSLSLPSHAHTRTHTHTHCDMDLTSAFCFSVAAAAAAADALVVVVCTALVATTLGQKEQRRLQRR